MSQSINTQVEKIQALIAEGMTMEAALTKVLSESANTTKRDNVAHIHTLRNIPEVRRFRKIAYAKISKSQNNPVACDRYRLEIAAADEVLNGLLAEVTAAEIPWVRAMELGEDAKAAFNYFFQDYKEDIDKRTEVATKGFTQAQKKAEVLKMTPIIDDAIPELLRPVAKQRTENGDMMVVTVLKKAHYLKTLTQE